MHLQQSQKIYNKVATETNISVPSSNPFVVLNGPEQEEVHPGDREVDAVSGVGVGREVRAPDFPGFRVDLDAVVDEDFVPVPGEGHVLPSGEDTPDGSSGLLGPDGSDLGINIIYL